MEEYNRAIAAYFTDWRTLVNGASDQRFWQDQKPTAVAWKVQDQAELLDRFNELRADCDQIHWGWVNDRWLVTMHLKDRQLAQGVTVIKLMQRRPSSKDCTGLDHIDFWQPNNQRASDVLRHESLSWTPENNGSHCSWISIWFAGTEAKIRTDTVLNPCISELVAVNQKLLQ